MVQRVVATILFALLLVVHAQMWLGRGGVPKVAALQQTLAQQQAANARARLINDQLASEVEDLKQGLGMVEEKARMELGMVRPNEIFVRVIEAEPQPKGEDQ